MEKNIRSFSKHVVVFVLYFISLFVYYEYENIDVTGYGKLFMYSLIGAMSAFELVCLFKFLHSKEKGTDYNFNYIIAIAFLIFAVISIGCGIWLRSSEENMAKEYYNENKWLYEPKDSKEFINKIMSDEKEFEKIFSENDYENKRLVDIYREIEDEPNVLYRYFEVFTTGKSLRYKYNEYGIFVYGGHKTVAFYYTIYLLLSVASIIQFIYYSSASQRDKRTDILDIN